MATDDGQRDQEEKKEAGEGLTYEPFRRMNTGLRYDLQRSHCWHLTGQRMPSVTNGGATWQAVRCCWCNTSQTVTFFDDAILTEGHGLHHPGFEERYRLDPEWQYAPCPARRASV